MIEKVRQSMLFAGLSETELEACLQCSRSQVMSYPKDDWIFRQEDRPDKLMMLVEGTVLVGNDTRDGRRSIVASIDQPGELFGEVFLFLNRQAYDHYAQAAADTKILQIPKSFLYHTCGNNCGCHAKLIANMLSILAQKAYFLNRRLQVVSCATLRQKIAKLLLQDAAPDDTVPLSLNREELADYLNAARPSVSRELMRMQQEGLLQLDRRQVRFDRRRLQDEL